VLYYEKCLQLLREFKDFCLEHISRVHNEEANRLAQHASGYQPILVVFLLAISADDWRKEIVDYLRDPSKKVERRIRFQATKYVLLDVNCIIVLWMEFCLDVLVMTNPKL